MASLKAMLEAGEFVVAPGVRELERRHVEAK